MLGFPHSWPTFHHADGRISSLEDSVSYQGLHAMLSHSLGSTGMELPREAQELPQVSDSLPVGSNNPRYSWYSSQLLPPVQSMLMTDEVFRSARKHNFCEKEPVLLCACIAYHTTTVVAGDRGCLKVPDKWSCSVGWIPSLWKVLSGGHWPETQIFSHFIVHSKCLFACWFLRSPYFPYYSWYMKNHDQTAKTFVPA